MTETDTVAGKGDLGLTGFAGSLRNGSFNRALLFAAAELAPEGMEIDIHDLDGIPLYNADVEAEGDPAPVVALKEAITRADGLIIACPEYNHGVPGVLKNAIDWASRPARGSPLNGKRVGIIGASAGMTGSARGQSQLRQSFVFTNTHAMLQPEILIARAKEKFDPEGRLTDEATRKFLGKYMEALRDWIAEARV